MNIIATDTSTQALSVAIRTDNFFEERVVEGRSLQHSEKLIPMVVEMCSDAGITTKDVEFLACTRGPGSFTGLRIGMAALKGMAYALNKPLVSVSTLEVIANCVPCFDGAVVTALDAKKQRWYLAVFEKKDEKPAVRMMADTDGTEADLIPYLKDYATVLVTGHDAEAFAEKLKDMYGESKRIIIDRRKVTGNSACLIECALRRFQTEGADDVGQGPVYLRKSDAEIALEQRQGEERT